MANFKYIIDDVTLTPMLENCNYRNPLRINEVEITAVLDKCSGYYVVIYIDYPSDIEHRYNELSFEELKEMFNLPIRKL